MRYTTLPAELAAEVYRSLLSEPGEADEARWIGSGMRWDVCVLSGCVGGLLEAEGCDGVFACLGEVERIEEVGDDDEGVRLCFTRVSSVACARAPSE